MKRGEERKQTRGDDCNFFFCRNVLCELTQLSIYRQKEIINEISRYVYPIVIDKKHEFTIANIKLPQADDRIYQAPSSKRVCVYVLSRKLIFPW